MNKDTCRTFGRGQALQRVMDYSAAVSNVSEIRMANYTNEKIMDFLKTLSHRNEVGPPAQNLPSRNLELPLEDEELEDACTSFESERQWENTEPSMSMKANIKHKDPTPVTKIIPGQFTFKEEDFPPL